MEKLARNKVRDEKMYQESLSGTKFIMDLPNGMKAYQLITSQALDFEGKYMGHCIGQGSYDKFVSDGSIKIYSIRDSNGEPHATLEVRGQDVYQCKGKGNRTPVQRYIPTVQGFVEAQELEIKHDLKNVGLIKQDGKYYSIYDLPDGFVVEGDLDLSGMDLKGVNLNIKVTGTLNLSRAKNIKLPKIADFSKSQEVVFRETDLSGVKEIKWPKEKIYLSLTKNLPSVLDFSGMTEVYLRYADLSRVKEIKWPKGTIDLGWTKNLPSVLDFSGMTEVVFRETDLSGVKEIKWPINGDVLNIDIKNLPDNILKSYQLWQAKKRVNMMISKAIDKIKKGVNNINNIINNEHNRL